MQQATLSVSQTSNNDARVNTQNIGSASTSDGWTMTVYTDIGYNWLIDFTDDNWKFRSDRPSTLTLKVYSNSQFGNTNAI